MLGEPVRVAFLDRIARGALVQESARPELDRDGEQQDEQDPAEQPQRVAR